MGSGRLVAEHQRAERERADDREGPNAASRHPAIISIAAHRMPEMGLSASPAPPELLLFSREGCHLCDEARDAIDLVLDERRRSGRPIPPFREVDIATDPALEAAYRERIPVVALGDEHLELVIGARRLARLMERVLDGVAAA